MVYSGDVHGSELVWLKFLKASEEYNADMVFMNGDLTGKKIVPIAEMKDGTWKTPNIFGKVWILKTREEVEEMMQKIRYAGMYPWVAPYDDIVDYAKDKKKWDKLFLEIMKQELDRWLTTAEEKLKENVEIIVAPGNDDPFEIDEIIKKHKRIIYPNDKVVWLDDQHPMITCEWVNPTPWDSPREEPEGKLEKRLRKKFEMIEGEDYKNVIAAFHAPPYDSGIDMAPKLDKKMRPVLVGGHPVMVPVGSKAVRKVLEEFQPLLGLHSHIHESPGEVNIGKTISINPGSEYDRGILRTYILDIGSSGLEKYWRITG